ncbi:MAG: sulfite exporter TauE/SafE family protein [Pseudanabaenaceae cyanobacterium bins.39]|nr:sulfite exporter TauE/SafE family protein [Pseudanabaenaceae cyanobacterium bins.39]
MDEIKLLYLSVVSFAAWVVSTLAGGGSPFILIPLINVLMGSAFVPPVITVGMFLGNAHRVFLFWKYIDWRLTLWYAPGAIAGAILGAYTFTQIHLDWLQLIIGVFLVISAILFALEKKAPEPNLALVNEVPPLELEATDPPKFQLQTWHILPAGFLKAFVSGLVGTTGPVLNPFYLRYGLIKEHMIATKAAHVVIIHLVKIATYGTLAAISTTDVIAGLAIGLAAIPANLVGKFLIARMSSHQFRQVVLAFMLCGGTWMLGQQLFGSVF